MAMCACSASSCPFNVIFAASVQSSDHSAHKLSGAKAGVSAKPILFRNVTNASSSSSVGKSSDVVKAAPRLQQPSVQIKAVSLAAAPVYQDEPTRGYLSGADLELSTDDLIDISVFRDYRPYDAIPDPDPVPIHDLDGTTTLLSARCSDLLYDIFAFTVHYLL